MELKLGRKTSVTTEDGIACSSIGIASLHSECFVPEFLQLFVLKGSGRGLIGALHGVQPKRTREEDTIPFCNSAIFSVLGHVLFATRESVGNWRSSTGTITKTEVELREDMGPTNLPFCKRSLRHEGFQVLVVSENRKRFR